MEGSTNPHGQEENVEGQNALLQQITSLIDSALARNMVNVERLVEDRISHWNHDQHNAHGTQGGKHKETVDGESSHTKSDRVSFKTFKSCGALEYQGTETPIGACVWMDNMEKVFDISHCWDEDRVIYAAAMLSGDALSWWSARKMSLGEEQAKAMTWKEFQAEFMQQYCPKDQKDKYEQEFIALQQGAMTVTVYEAEFNRKSKFATALLSSEEVKVRRFIQGLRWNIREAVLMQNPQTLADATRCARLREDILREKDTDLMPPPKKAHTDFQPSTRSFSESTASDQSISRNRSQSSVPQCNNCGRRHFGLCKAGQSFNSSRTLSSSPITCYHCGKVGHIALSCPDRVAHLVCFECGVIGHVRRNCPKLQPTGSTASVSQPVSTSEQSRRENAPHARPRTFQIITDENREPADLETGMSTISKLSVHMSNIGASTIETL